MKRKHLWMGCFAWVGLVPATSNGQELNEAITETIAGSKFEAVFFRDGDMPRFELRAAQREQVESAGLPSRSKAYFYTISDYLPIPATHDQGRKQISEAFRNVFLASNAASEANLLLSSGGGGGVRLDYPNGASFRLVIEGEERLVDQFVAEYPYIYATGLGLMPAREMTSVVRQFHVCMANPAVEEPDPADSDCVMTTQPNQDLQTYHRVLGSSPQVFGSIRELQSNTRYHIDRFVRGSLREYRQSWQEVTGQLNVRFLPLKETNSYRILYAYATVLSNEGVAMRIYDPSLYEVPARHCATLGC